MNRMKVGGQQPDLTKVSRRLTYRRIEEAYVVLPADGDLYKASEVDPGLDIVTCQRRQEVVRFMRHTKFAEQH